MKNNLKPEENVNCGITTVTTKNPNKNEWNVIGKTSGIYKIINNVNGKYYVGSSENVFRRWYHHKHYLNKNRHINPHLQNAWNKYGENIFDFIIIEEVSPDKLILEEQKYLNVAKQEPHQCYNICWETSSVMFGRKHTEKTKELIRQRSPKYGKENGMFGVKRCGKENPNFGNHKLRGKNNPSFNDTTYSFINKNTRKTFVGTLWEFYTKYGLSQSNVSNMVNKEQQRSVKGWKLSTPQTSQPLHQQ